MSGKDLILDDESPEMLAMLTRYFSVLLLAHTKYLKRSSAKEISPLAKRFNTLLMTFAEAEKRSTAREAAEAKADGVQIQGLLNSFGIALIEHRRQQENTANDFNILETLQLTGKEVRHSMVLAWLLDADMDRHGTHAQGPLGFRLFLNALGLPEQYADCRYWVRREVRGGDAIVDIEIASRGNYLIHIENKIWASEGSDQTNREWADIQRRAVSLGLDPLADSDKILALYLTPTGVAAANTNFRTVSWRRIVNILEAFARVAKPKDVKLFADHYARGIKRFIATQAEENEDGETNIE